MPKLENPWDVESLYDLQYFNCPSCAYKNGSKQDFVCHAFDTHPDSVDYLRNIIDGSLGDILCPWDSNDYKSEDYNENDVTENLKVEVNENDNNEDLFEVQEMSSPNNHHEASENGQVENDPNSNHHRKTLRPWDNRKKEQSIKAQWARKLK